MSRVPSLFWRTLLPILPNQSQQKSILCFDNHEILRIAPDARNAQAMLFRKADELPRYLNESLCNYLEDGEHLERIASFLVHHPETRLKLPALDFLMQENNIEISNALHCLVFCCCEQDVVNTNITNSVLFWELRARCLRLKKNRGLLSRIDPWLLVQDYIVEHLGLEVINDCYNLYQAGVKNQYVLESLVHHKTPETLNHLAEFLVSDDIDNSIKRMALAYMRPRRPETFEFCVHEAYECQENFDDAVLWELRATCLNMLRDRRITHERYMEAATVASNCIYDTASGIERVIAGSTAALSGGVLELSELVIQQMEPGKTNFENSTAVQISETTKHVTEKARLASSTGIQFIKDTSMKQLNAIELEKSKTSLQVTTKIATAALASAAIIGESVVTNTGVLATCVSQGVSNVISHKYGKDSGKIVKNTTDAIGNCIRTVSIFSTTGTKMTETVAKHAAKTSIQREKEERCGRSLKSERSMGRESSELGLSESPTKNERG